MAMALRGMRHSPARSTCLTTTPARPVHALLPFRGAQAAFISNSASKQAEPVTQKPGLVSGGPGAPLPMKTISGKTHTEVPLPSQEGKQGAIQYALYDI